MEEIKSAILESNLTKLNLFLSQIEVSELNISEIKELIKLSKSKGVVKIEITLLLKYKTELHSLSKKEKEAIILALIEELSEDIYCSGWNDGIEKDIWNWRNGSAKRNKVFENRVITSHSKIATDLGKEIGLWAEWNDKHHEPKAITMAEWIKKETQ
jgi:hypothetical protein